jgi:hypothetical protein
MMARKLDSQDIKAGTSLQDCILTKGITNSIIGFMNLLPDVFWIAGMRMRPGAVWGIQTNPL